MEPGGEALVTRAMGADESGRRDRERASRRGARGRARGVTNGLGGVGHERVRVLEWVGWAGR